MPTPQTVHVGHFSAALKPVLTINSGDIVIIDRERARPGRS
jgi:acetamidase/formamidase